MHLVASSSHHVSRNSDFSAPKQKPAELIFITMAASDMGSIANAAEALHKQKPKTEIPQLAVINPDWLPNSASVEKWFKQHSSSAKMIVARLIGGAGSWRAGVETLSEIAKAKGIKLAWLSGDDREFDPELEAESTLRGEEAAYLDACLRAGGSSNLQLFLKAAAEIIADKPAAGPAAKTLPKAQPDLCLETFGEQHQHCVFILAYRAWHLAGDTQPCASIANELARRGIGGSIAYLAGFRSKQAMQELKTLMQDKPAKLVVSLMGFTGAEDLIAQGNAAWIQLVSRSGMPAQNKAEDNPSDGAKDMRGLTPSELAMQIATPELDGRIGFEKIAHRAPAENHPLCQCPISRFTSKPEQITYLGEYLAAYLRLARAENPDKNVAIMLANYPVRDGRMANGVGLDTPESVLLTLQRLAEAGYKVDNIPASSDELIASIKQGPTNQEPKRGTSKARLSLADYLRFLDTLPPESRAALEQRWGAPQSDPFFRPRSRPNLRPSLSNEKSSEEGEFFLPVRFFGKVAVALQVARGWGVDDTEAVHDPELVPPHSYIALYLWIREHFQAHALLHFGKHGTLEWLPGKAVTLSASCWSRIVLGALPHIYPFIVNDPGEGTQAKRRSHAVIVDHLMPPPTGAGAQDSYLQLENMLDEYADAQSLDPRRAHYLAHEILHAAEHERLDLDCKFDSDEDEDEKLKKLDQFLCELKEYQIRDGLHTFGIAPAAEMLNETLTILARAERGGTQAQKQSLLRALALDLKLSFDPLAADPKLDLPESDKKLLKAPKLRSIAHAISLLMEMARHYMRTDTQAHKQATASQESKQAAGYLLFAPPLAQLERSAKVVSWAREELAALINDSALKERSSLLTALRGQHVEPGPSGSPSRGRVDVLPTGRNFYGVDPRAVPTKAAMDLGKRSAHAMLERYEKEHGKTPQAMTITAWGTSAIRTGGEDIAQALALIGAEVEYSPSSGRVSGFRVIPDGALRFPRVDVTIRVSGFFRDAFGHLIELFSSAARAIMLLEQTSYSNALAQHYQRDLQELAKQGIEKDQAAQLASARVFSSRPGTYGAGLNLLIDSGQWSERADFGKAFISWSSYAYGNGLEGKQAQSAFSKRIEETDAIVQNQDNREHDVLDADDFYQFEGGLASSVFHLSGKDPVIFHNDTSNPERPMARLLDEEIAGVVRARASNPKWLKGIMRHGYKGGAEIAATLDYLFAFAATTRAVREHHFDLVYKAWLENADIVEFFKKHNPDALQDIKARFREAIDRGMWHPRSNRVHVEIDYSAN